MESKKDLGNDELNQGDIEEDIEAKEAKEAKEAEKAEETKDTEEARETEKVKVKEKVKGKAKMVELENAKKEMEEKLAAKNSEFEELDARYTRLQADFVNFRKRTEKERESLYAYASEEIISQMLQVIDNFERALASMEDKEDSFFKGMKMIYDQLVKVLSDNGLEEIKALGEKFDPNYHHAVVQEESKEHDVDTIIEVLQKGYKIKEKVI